MRVALLSSFALPLIAVAQTISFLPPVVVARGGAHVVSTCSNCVAVADFNGDGKPDIAFTVQTPLPESGFDCCCGNESRAHDASTSTSTCTVGSVNVTVTYAGPEVVFAGLDQVNLLLPSSLAGLGIQPVNCVFNQVYGSNTVNVTFH